MTACRVKRGNVYGNDQSLDAITMLPRTAEAADIQGRENQLMEHAALQPGSQFQEKVKRNQRQAVETQNSEKMNKDGGSGKGDLARWHEKKKKERRKSAGSST